MGVSVGMAGWDYGDASPRLYKIKKLASKGNDFMRNKLFKDNNSSIGLVAHKFSLRSLLLLAQGSFAQNWIFSRYFDLLEKYLVVR